MEEFGRYLLDVLGEIAGGRGDADDDMPRFALSAVFWAIVWIVALSAYRRDPRPRESLLLVGFGVGFAQALFMLGVKSLKLYGLVSAESLELFFPPIDHVLTLLMRVIVAAAFLRYLLDSPSLSRRYMTWGFAASGAFYLVVAPVWWSTVLRAESLIKFSHVWGDWMAHLLGAVLSASAMLLFLRASGWIRGAICIAFGMFLLDDVLMLVNLATAEAYKPAFAPVRHNLQLWAIPLFGYVFLREQRQEYDRLIAKKQQSEHLESVGRLASGIAHDFNNHLQVIHGYSELGQSRTDDAANMKTTLGHINDAAERASVLVDQLMAFNRQEEKASEESIQLNDLVTELTPMLTRLIGAEIDIVVKLDRELPEVLAEQSVVEQILLNLSANARDAMPDGGVLTVRTEVRRIPGTTGRTEPKTGARLIVTDTGAGMSAETRRHAFEPFFTTKPIGQGTGLGLATTHSAVSRLGGQIEIESELARGTTFILDFPPSGRVSRPRTVQPKEPKDLSGRETVLVAEDEPAVREFMRDVLTSAGYVVLVAENGEEAVDVFARSTRRIDLLLFDVAMPRLNGYLAFDRIRARLRHVPALFVTADTTRAARRRPDLPHLNKPFDRTELLEAVRHRLDRAMLGTAGSSVDGARRPAPAGTETDTLPNPS